MKHKRHPTKRNKMSRPRRRSVYRYETCGRSIPPREMAWALCGRCVHIWHLAEHNLRCEDCRQVSALA